MATKPDQGNHEAEKLFDLREKNRASESESESESENRGRESERERERDKKKRGCRSGKQFPSCESLGV